MGWYKLYLKYIIKVDRTISFQHVHIHNLHIRMQMCMCVCELLKLYFSSVNIEHKFFPLFVLILFA